MPFARGFSPPTPRFQSRHTSTPFNSASDAFQLHPDVRSYGPSTLSNPARQSLFEFDDCLDGGAPKASTAAARLKKIFPGVDARGVRASIPMPGHHACDGDDEETKRVLKDVDDIDALIETHDVVFLLTDTRESRWLPTLMCAAKNKLLINAALGFDSYLVMRHGAGVGDGDGEADEEEEEEAAESRGKDGDGDGETDASLFKRRLGCYFCNDVMAPGNSTRDRTLDQQCTVTRPGLAPIAGALAVEMMVALRHAPPGPDPGGGGAPTATGIRLPASTAPPPLGADPPTPLGIVPHQVRGHLAEYAQRLFAAPAYPKCTACSRVVVNAYRGGGGAGVGEMKTEAEARSIHWSPYDRVRVVNADP